jgi:hypothetical protein
MEAGLTGHVWSIEELLTTAESVAFKNANSN